MIKKLREFHIGEWVIVDEEYSDISWYHNKPMKILGFKDDGQKDHQLLIVNYKFHSFFDTSNTISSSLVKFFPMREEKLKRILGLC